MLDISNAIKTFNQTVEKIQNEYSAVFKHSLFIDLMNVAKSMKGTDEVCIPVAKKESFSKSEIREIVLDEIKKLDLTDKTDPHKFPYFLPKNYKWENITIKFKDGHNIKIEAGKYTYTASYKEMGFEDGRSQIPDLQWNLLKFLSTNNGCISWKDTKANAKVKKKKQLLSKGLKKYFGIGSDPFKSYRKEKAYELKLQILPENQSSNYSDEKEKSDPLGIHDHLRDITRNR